MDNKQTRDGDGTVVRSDDLDDIVNLENVAFDYGIDDVNDPTQLGIAFAWCSVNEHVLDEENKAAGTIALDFILNSQQALPHRANR